MKPLSPGPDNDLYECVYLAGHPALTASNSSEPPGSYHSRDVFTPHPTIPDRWKYVSRLDDRVTLLNGEKVLPLPIEGCIKQSPVVEDAVVVGVGKAVPGLLLFRAEQGQQVQQVQPVSSEEEEEWFIDSVWPVIQDANSRAEQFSQITREMVAVLPVGSVRPQTDKGSMIRAQVYTRYADVIEGLYARVDERGADGGTGGTLCLSREETEGHLMKLVREELGLGMAILDSAMEFFTAGVDSLKAIQLRRLVVRDFAMEDGKGLGQNVVFEAGCVSKLAELICAMQAGQTGDVHLDEDVMEDLVARHSSFRDHVPVSERKHGRGVVSLIRSLKE